MTLRCKNKTCCKLFSPSSFGRKLNAGEFSPRLWPSPFYPLLLQGVALAAHEKTSGALQDSDIRVNTNLGGCDKQSDCEPESLQIERHETWELTGKETHSI